MKRFVVLLAGAAIVLGSAGVVDTATATPQRAAASTVRSFVPSSIAWSKCKDGFLASLGAQCGFLTVPMDYAKPKGAKIKIAVSRLLHTSDAAHYQGAMFTNPGGPGGAGRYLVYLQSRVPNKVGFDYDWYGFDPRGTGASVPSLSCNQHFFHGDRPPYRPTSSKIMKKWVTRSKAYAADCAKAPGHALFKHVRTTDSVADMESLRKSIGKSKINYYGFSYGTYLGSVYMTMHPNRVRRFVLDSTVDPRKVFYKSNLAQDVAFQKTFTIYLHWLAKYHRVYHVGSTYKKVRATYLATIAKLDRHAAHGVLGGDELIDDFTSAGYYVYGWETIGAAYSKLINHHNAKPLITMFQQANPTTKGGDNSYALYLGTQCTDAHWPHSQSKLNRDSVRLNRKHDYFTWSNAWFNGPCAYWKFPARHTPVHVTGNHVHAKILMIDETYDPATPYSGSLYVRSIFPSASLIEGKNGTTHAGSLSGVSCTDDAIARYLATGKTPKRRSGNRSDKVCPPVPKPNPTATSAMSSAGVSSTGSTATTSDATIAFRELLASVPAR